MDVVKLPLARQDSYPLMINNWASNSAHLIMQKDRKGPAHCDRSNKKAPTQYVAGQSDLQYNTADYNASNGTPQRNTMSGSRALLSLQRTGWYPRTVRHLTHLLA